MNVEVRDMASVEWGNRSIIQRAVGCQCRGSEKNKKRRINSIYATERMNVSITQQSHVPVGHQYQFKTDADSCKHPDRITTNGY